MKRLAMSFTLVLMVAACSSGPPAPPPFTPAGVFDVSFELFGQQIAGTITIEEMDGAYTGNLTIPIATVPLSEFTVDGSTVTFSGVSPQGTFVFTLTYEGEGFVGEISSDLGNTPITGVKR